MRNSHNITLTNNDSLTEVEDTTWSLPGAVVGFLSWLCALAIPMLIYGSNTLLFFIYTWPFFLALMPVAVVVGIALHSLMDGKLRYSIVFTLATVGIMFGALFIIQSVTNNEIMFCTPWVYVTIDKCGTFARVVAVSPTEDVESSSDAWDEDAVFQGAGWVN